MHGRLKFEEGCAGLRLSVVLFMLTLAVTPANVYMLQRSDLFGIPLWILVARLPLQLALLALILWSTRTPATDGPNGARGADSLR